MTAASTKLLDIQEQYAQAVAMRKAAVERVVRNTPLQLAKVCFDMRSVSRSTLSRSVVVLSTRETDRDHLADTLRQLLGVPVRTYASAEELVAVWGDHRAACVVIDVEGTGSDWIKAAMTLPREVRVVLWAEERGVSIPRESVTVWKGHGHRALQALCAAALEDVGT